MVYYSCIFNSNVFHFMFLLFRRALYTVADVNFYVNKGLLLLLLQLLPYPPQKMAKATCVAKTGRDGASPRDRLATLGPLVDAVAAAKLAMSRQPDARMVLAREERSARGTCYTTSTQFHSHTLQPPSQHHLLHFQEQCLSTFLLEWNPSEHLRC